LRLRSIKAKEEVFAGWLIVLGMLGPSVRFQGRFRTMQNLQRDSDLLALLALLAR